MRDTIFSLTSIKQRDSYAGWFSEKEFKESEEKGCEKFVHDD